MSLRHPKLFFKHIDIWIKTNDYPQKLQNPISHFWSCVIFKMISNNQNKDQVMRNRVKAGAATPGGLGGAMPPPGFFQYIGVPFSPNTVFLNAYFHVSIMFSNIECLHNNDFISY